MNYIELINFIRLHFFHSEFDRAEFGQLLNVSSPDKAPKGALSCQPYASRFEVPLPVAAVPSHLS